MISLLLLFGCVDDNINVPDSDDDGFITAKLVLDVPGTYTSRTYAIAADDESAVETIFVLVFTRETPTGEETFRYIAPIQSTDLANDNVTVKLEKSSGEQASGLVILANTSIGGSLLTPGMTKADVQALIAFAGAGKWNAAGSADFTPFPMWGESESKSISEGTSFDTVTLLRSVVRIDVGFNFTNFTNGAEAAAGIDDNTLEEVRLYRAKDKGYVIPAGGNMSATIPNRVEAATVPPDAGTNGAIIYSGNELDGTKCVRQIYLAENIAGTAADNTCLVLGIRSSSTGQLTYYRVNATSTGGTAESLIPLLRNHRYVFNITAITAEGFTDPDQALQSTVSNIEWEVTEWDESITDINVSGNYFLGVSGRRVQLAGYSGSTNTLIFDTNLPQADISTAWADTSQTDFSMEFDYAARTITFTALNENSSADTITQVLNITAGSINISITVIQTIISDFTYGITTILGIGQEYATYGYFVDKSASLAFMQSRVNFGLNTNSKVKTEGFTYRYISSTTNADKNMVNGISGGNVTEATLRTELDKNPDIVVIGYYVNLDATVSTLLSDYVKRGGVLILFAESTGNPTTFFQTFFGSSSISATGIGSGGDVFRLSDTIDDIITNGPFGNFRGLTWGQDYVGAIAILDLPEDELVIYSRDSDRASSVSTVAYPVMFRHKTYNLFWVGDGGFISNDKTFIGGNPGTATYAPFAVDGTFAPIPRLAYGPSGNFTIYNSYIFGNIMAWAMRQAEFNGID